MSAENETRLYGIAGELPRLRAGAKHSRLIFILICRRILLEALLGVCLWWARKLCLFPFLLSAVRIRDEGNSVDPAETRLIEDRDP